MENLIFKCSECGHSKEVLGNICDIVECELCGNLMDLEDIEETQEITVSQKELGSIIAIDGMKQNLQAFGNNKTWYLCEELFADPKTRLRYRQIFFEAGGKIPEKELKI